MEKRGQIYILAAIIIGFLLFTIISPINIVHQKITDDDFEELSENYKRESAKLMNEILNEQERTAVDLEEYFLNFTLLFTSYSKTKNPHFGIIYAFPFNNNLLMGNYIDREVTFTPGGALPGCFNDVQASVAIQGLHVSVGNVNVASYRRCITRTNYPANNLLEFTIDGVPYKFTLSRNNPDIIVVSREALGEDIKVFTSTQGAA